MDLITFEQLPNVVGEIRDRLLRIEGYLEKNFGSASFDDSKMLTISEAAKLLSLSTSTIYSKVCKMQIPVHKKGKRLYFERSELYEWIRGGQRKTVEDLYNEADEHLRNMRIKPRRAK